MGLCMMGDMPLTSNILAFIFTFYRSIKVSPYDMIKLATGSLYFFTMILAARYFTYNHHFENYHFYIQLVGVKPQ